MEAGPKEGKSQAETPARAYLGEGTWSAKESPDFERKQLEFEYAFAQEIQRREGIPLIKAIQFHTWLLRMKAFDFEGYKVLGLKEGVTEENVVDFTDSTLRSIPTTPDAYHSEEENRFGCFSYDREDDSLQSVRIHFFNHEFDEKGPLSEEKRSQRTKELFDMLNDIRQKHPEVTTITGNSWLYNRPEYQMLFPKSYTDSLAVKTEEYEWYRGSTIWGQFVDSAFKFREEKARELLDSLKSLPAGEPMIRLLNPENGLYPPLTASGPIQDFYEMYGITQ